eukprot:1295536-Alexandrium_andersonii.AAC.1
MRGRRADRRARNDTPSEATTTDKGKGGGRARTGTRRITHRRPAAIGPGAAELKVRFGALGASQAGWASGAVGEMGQ